MQQLLHKPTCFRPSRPHSNRLHRCRRPERGISPSPVFAELHTPRYGIEPTDYSFQSVVGATLSDEGITRESLPRTGRATLDGIQLYG